VESRPDGKVKKEDEKKEIRERTSSSYHFKTFFRLLLLDRSLPYILLSFSFHSYLDERRERWEEAEEGDWKWRYKRCV
jgi:hypothetical protein